MKGFVIYSCGVALLCGKVAKVEFHDMKNQVRKPDYTTFYVFTDKKAFTRCVAYNDATLKMAEIARDLRKDDWVFLCGKYHVKKQEDAEGKKRRAILVVPSFLIRMDARTEESQKRRMEMERQFLDEIGYGDEDISDFKV